MTDRFTVRQRVLILGSRLLGQGQRDNWRLVWACGFPWSAIEFERSIQNLIGLDLYYLARNIEHYEHGPVDIENEESIARGAGVNAWIRSFAECEDVFNEFTPLGYPISQNIKVKLDQIIASHKPLSFRWRSADCEDSSETDRLVKWLIAISTRSTVLKPCV
jgi:hypothetical protein